MSRTDTKQQKETYDHWYGQPEAAHWEEAPGKNVLLAALGRCCDTWSSLRLLDIGCGTGSFLDRIRLEVSSHWELHGVDLSAVAIAQGTRPGSDLHLAQGDATRLDFPAESFDIVTCYGSWEHFPEPVRAISAAARVLAPGGRTFAMIPALGIHRTDREDEGWYEDTEVPGSEAQQLQWNLRRSTWSRMFEEAGIHLFKDSLARSCGAHKPGVFFFGQKVRSLPADAPSEGATGEAFRELARLATRMARDLEADVETAAATMAASLQRGGKILACGNGGSAADAQHFVAELVGRLRQERDSLAAISLAVDPSVVTALANDYGYDRVFARQVEGLGRAGDVLLVISTSGRSPNVIEAVRAAQQSGLATVALLGGTRVAELADSGLAIHVPHEDGQRIQEGHTAVLHAICSEVETRLQGGGGVWQTE